MKHVKTQNYIAKAIGDTSYNAIQDGTDYFIQSSGSYSNKSKYVRVKTVNTPTPDFFDNNGTAKNEFTGSIPVVANGPFNYGSGSLFPGAQVAKFNQDITNTNIQGIIANDYNTALNLMAGLAKTG